MPEQMSWVARTSRLSHAEGDLCPVDLRKRRRWFGDDPAGQDAPKTPPATPGQWRIEDLPEPVQVYIRELRAEAASRRVALDKEKEAATLREQQRLAEEGKWKELAEQRARQAAELEPFKTRAETLETMLRQSNDERVKKVPDSMRSLVPTDYPPEKLSGWLDANWERLSARPAPELDAGAGSGAGKGGTAVTLDAQERQIAAAMGMTAEAYLKEKVKLQKATQG